MSEDKTTPSRAAGWMMKLGPVLAHAKIEAGSRRGASARRHTSFCARPLPADELIQGAFAGAGVARLPSLGMTDRIEAEAR